ncbi:MAG: carbohydrate ABC transporter permease [Microbacterium sp.]
MRRRGWLWTLVTVVILAAYLVPIYLMLSASFQPDASSASVDWFPTHPGLEGYADVISSGGLRRLRTSLIVAVGSVLVTLVIAIPAAYSLSRLRSRIVGVSLLLLLLAQMIPSVVLANSFYAMFNSAGLLNSYVGLILANATAGVPFAIILMRSFMLRLDHEIVEASTIDGLGTFGSLVRIVVPLSRNAIITSAVFTFLFAWGDLLFGLTLVTQTNMYPVTVFVYQLSGSQFNTWAQVMAASLMAALPALVVILALQRYVKAGIASGAVR